MTPERRERLESRLRFEQMPGDHEYHRCPRCNVNVCRGKLCAGCITKLLKRPKPPGAKAMRPDRLRVYIGGVAVPDLPPCDYRTVRIIIQRCETLNEVRYIRVFNDGEEKEFKRDPREDVTEKGK